MAIFLSKNSQIEIGAAAVGQLLSWDTADTDASVETTNFDSTRREYEPLNLIDGDFNCEAQYDLADTGQDAATAGLGAAAVAIVIYPAGNTTGLARLTSTVLIGSHSVTAGGVEDTMNVSYAGKVLGPWVEDVVPA